MGTGAFRVRFFAFQDFVDNRVREPARRLAQIAAHHVDHAVRKGHFCLRIFDLRAG